MATKAPLAVELTQEEHELREKWRALTLREKLQQLFWQCREC